LLSDWKLKKDGILVFEKQNINQKIKGEKTIILKNKMIESIFSKISDWFRDKKNHYWNKSNSSLQLINNNFEINVYKYLPIILIFSLLITSGFLLNEVMMGDHTIYSSKKNGAICNDNWISHSVGSGACSHHGGVKSWTYQEVGFHYYNPHLYINIIYLIVAFTIGLFIYSKNIRQRLIAILFELLYRFLIIKWFLVCIIFGILFMVFLPFYIIYLLLNKLYEE
jgi:hypothetical protein